MVFYIFLFVFLSFLLFFSGNSKSFSGFFLFLFFLTLFWVAGFRGDVGQDTLSYGTIYTVMVDWDALKHVLTYQEPFQPFLMYFHKKIFDSYTGFLVLSAFLQMILLYYAIKNMQHKYVFLFFYLLIFFLHQHFGAQRAAFSLLFFLASLSDINVRPKRAVVWAIMSIMSHVSILIVFPVLMLRGGVRIKRILIMVGGGVIVSAPLFVFFGDLVLTKLEIYEFFDFSQFHFPKITSLLIFVLFFSFFMTKKIKLDALVSAVLLAVFMFSSSYTDIAYRFYKIALAVLMFILFSERLAADNYFRFKPIVVGIFCMSFWFSFSEVRYLATEKQTRTISGRGNVDFTYVPYSLFYESKYRD